MKKLLLILICLFVSFEVKSDDNSHWDLVTIGKESRNKWYITDVMEIENEIHFWLLQNRTDGTSNMSKESINCKTKKITLFQFTSFSKHFGEGEVLASMNYDEIKKSDNSVSYVGPKDTITRFYYNYVCKQK